MTLLLGRQLEKMLPLAKHTLEAYSLGRDGDAPSRQTQPSIRVQGLVYKVWTRFQPPLIVPS